MTYFKVVWQDAHHKTLHSAMTEGEMRVDYIPGEKARSRHGLIFVFDSYRNAHGFCMSINQYRQNALRIWRCEIGEVAMPVDTVLHLSCVLPFKVICFWDDQDEMVNRLPVFQVTTIPAPKGTIATDYCILTEEVR